MEERGLFITSFLVYITWSYDIIILNKIGEEDEKAMINEINVLKSLDHPNIMKIYEYYKKNRRKSSFW